MSPLRRQTADIDHQCVEALREAPERHRQRRRIDDIAKRARPSVTLLRFVRMPVNETKPLHN
jgi:hypothetical protein